jgi:serine/threonine protein kinase
VQHPEDWSHDLNSLISHLLVKDPLVRPDITAVLDHPFLQLCLEPQPFELAGKKSPRPASK